MKNSQNIISCLINKIPNFKVFRELERLKIFLPLDMRKSVVYISLKNNTLFFAFDHPAYAYEFRRHEIDNIKTSLQDYKEQFPSIPPEVKITSFVPGNFIKPFKESEKNTTHVMIYKEHSEAKFENIAKDEKLYNEFEAIRKIILKNLDING